MATIAVISSHTRSLVNFRGPMLKAFLQAGHRVVAFGVEQDAGSEQALLDMGVEFQRWRLERAGLNPALDAMSLVDLTRKIDDVAPDMVLSYTMKPVAYGSLAARLAGVPKIYSMITGLGYAFIGSDAKAKLAGRVAARVLRAALRHNDKVMVFNSDIEQVFRERKIFRDADQCVRIGATGVDLDYYACSPIPDGPPVFLLIARLLADKGIREFVEAARSLKARWPDARFVIVGPYDPNPTAIQPGEVEEWVRDGVIEYPGSTQDVRPFLKECSVYVLPSYAEGGPRSVQEAMSTGRPIVTTYAPGCRETVRQAETGLLVPVGDSRALADAMEWFLRNPDKIAPMGLASRKLAEERFDVHAINQRIMNIMGLNAT